MGDFNVISSSDGCFAPFVTSSNPNTLFFDPPNQLGQWTSFPYQYADYLTQATRLVDPGDCNSTGPMANRFDHILITAPIKNGTDSCKYIPGSFTVIGQDGHHTNESLRDTPVNNSVPANVDSALYYMSEHLPVSLNLGFTYTVYAGIDEISQARDLEIKYNNIIANAVTILPVKSSIPAFLNNCEVILYDLEGRIISKSITNLNQTNTIDVSSL